MTTTLIPLSGIEGVNYNLTYTVYDQTLPVTATNSPDNPGPPFQVGTVSKGTGNSEWVFVKAGTAIGLGDCCLITSTTQSAAAITSALAAVAEGSQVGFAQVPIAINNFGWLQRSGACANINVAAVLLGAPLNTSATPGQLDDAAGTLIFGVAVTAAGGPGVLAGTLNQSAVAVV
jgi:hypothetical protein